MENSSEKTKNSLNEKPQHLCNQCGRCCSVIASNLTRDDIEKCAKEYPEAARLFTDILVEYPSIKAAREKDAETVDNILKRYSDDHEGKTDDLKFYYCPQLDKNNLCKIYETRPLTCRYAPKNAWSLFPPGCGFEGWQFREREKEKAFVRQLKEILYELSFTKDDNAKVTSAGMTKKEVVELINKKIEPFLTYGASNW